MVLADKGLEWFSQDTPSLSCLLMVNKFEIDEWGMAYGKISLGTGLSSEYKSEALFDSISVSDEHY